MAEDDLDARAEKTIRLYKTAQAEAEAGLMLWTMTARDLRKNNIELKHIITKHEATDAVLRQQIEQLQQELANTQRERDEISSAKDQVDLEISSLFSLAQNSVRSIGESIKKNKALQSEKHEALAKVETLQIHLLASEEREERLEEEVDSLKAALAASAAVKVGDKDPDIRTKELVHKPAPFQDHNTLERNISNQPTAHSPSSQALQDMINSQVLLIEKQNRKYDRLVAKKESAEKKFFSSYVDWHDFKVWWTEFRKYPGVGQKVLEFNREAKRSGQLQLPVKMPSSIEKRILKVVEAAERGGPDTFPSVAATDEANGANGVDGDLADTANTADPANAATSSFLIPLDQVRGIKREWQDTIALSESQWDPNPTTAKHATMVNDNGAANPTTEEVEMEIPESPLSANINAAPNENLDANLNAGDEPFDSDKTQETTPAKSQRPLQFDVTGLNIPPIEWHSASTRKQPTPNPPEPSPGSAQPKQPSKSPIVAVKEELQDDQTLGLLFDNAKVNSKNSTKPVTKSTSKTAPPFVSSLGKRKAPQDVAEDMEIEEDSLSDRSPLKFANEKGKQKEKGAASTQKRYEQRPRASANANANVHIGSSHSTSMPTATPSHVTKRRALGIERAKSPVAAEITDTKISASHGKQKSKASGGKTTINSRYEINPDRNDGLNFAFDQTVRKKAERKKLDAGVCEECREYYEAIGPMPPRAQPPLWRSPKAGDQPLPNSRTCHHHKGNRGGNSGNGDANSDEDDIERDKDAAIAAHRQQISRHRHQWRAPEDPPGYWNIGFPDTQEVADINRRAEEMHAQKERMVENEASKPNGKFRRR